MQERAKRLVRDLRRLIQLLDHDIDVEEERTDIPDLANSNYSATARPDRGWAGKLRPCCELEMHAGTTYH